MRFMTELQCGVASRSCSTTVMPGRASSSRMRSLIGIPHRLVIQSERNLSADELEYRHRRDSESRNLKREEALKLLKEVGQ